MQHTEADFILDFFLVVWKPVVNEDRILAFISSVSVNHFTNN